MMVKIATMNILLDISESMNHLCVIQEEKEKVIRQEQKDKEDRHRLEISALRASGRATEAEALGAKFENELKSQEQATKANTKAIQAKAAKVQELLMAETKAPQAVVVPPPQTQKQISEATHSTVKKNPPGLQSVFYSLDGIRFPTA